MTPIKQLKENLIYASLEYKKAAAFAARCYPPIYDKEDNPHFTLKDIQEFDTRFEKRNKARDRFFAIVEELEQQL